MKPLKGRLTVTRPMAYDNNFIRFEIKDENSRIDFLEFNIKLDDFARAITGQAMMEIEFTVDRVEHIGKRKETKRLCFSVHDASDRREYAEENAQKFADEGWIADAYFGSQTSFQKDSDGKWMAVGAQYRFVELE